MSWTTWDDSLNERAFALLSNKEKKPKVLYPPWWGTKSNMELVEQFSDKRVSKDAGGILMGKNQVGQDICFQDY